jgi:hypothetical protein
MKFLSVCEVCLQRYYLDDSEVYAPPNMRIRHRRKKNPYIGNWSDWLLHVQSHCPMCRVECPSNATDDLEKHKTALKIENDEITKEDRAAFPEIDDL